MQLSSLETIGGSLNTGGVQGLNIPKLRSVGGDFIVEGTGLEHLPPHLKHIGGNAIISSREPKSLLQELLTAKKSGVLKGAILVDELPYTEKQPKPILKS